MKLFDEYPYIESDTVVLKKMSAADADALSDMVKNEQLYRYLPTFLYEQKYEEIQEMLAKMDEECFLTKESLLLGIYVKKNPASSPAGEQTTAPPSAEQPPTAQWQFAGIAEFYNYEEKKGKASIGCRLLPAFWGQGLATAVIGMMKDYLFTQTDVRTITGHVMKANLASAGAAKKNGFLCKYPDLLEDWGFPQLVETDKFVFKKEWLDEADGERTGKVQSVRVEQFVMAYRIEQDRIRALLPDGFVSLRPVLRINTEIQSTLKEGENSTFDDSVNNRVYVEFNTPVEYDGRRGWLNISNWKSPADPVTFEREGNTVRICAPFLTLIYTGSGMEGGCPAEKDNDGCYFNVPHDTEFRPAETITANKEFCDCAFAWRFHEGDASGRSEGRTIPAYETPASKQYEKWQLTAENAAAIPCEQVLGAYILRFERRR